MCGFCGSSAFRDTYSREHHFALWYFLWPGVKTNRNFPFPTGEPGPRTSQNEVIVVSNWWRHRLSLHQFNNTNIAQFLEQFGVNFPPEKLHSPGGNYNFNFLYRPEGECWRDWRNDGATPHRFHLGTKTDAQVAAPRDLFGVPRADSNVNSCPVRVSWNISSAGGSTGELRWFDLDCLRQCCHVQFWSVSPTWKFDLFLFLIVCCAASLAVGTLRVRHCQTRFSKYRRSTVRHDVMPVESFGKRRLLFSLVQLLRCVSPRCLRGMSIKQHRQNNRRFGIPIFFFVVNKCVLTSSDTVIVPQSQWRHSL